MATTKSLPSSLVGSALLFLSFRYVGGFSWRQSLVLTTIGAIGYGLYVETRAQQRLDKAFSPFRVSIRPNWYQLLSDFKLIGSKGEWDRLCEGAAKVPTSEYSVFRTGITFTVTQRAPDFPLPGLTYWDNRRCFLTDLDFAEIIVPVEEEFTPDNLEKRHPFFNHPNWPSLPKLYFGLRGRGYEIGLVVNDKWWENLCKKGELGELAHKSKETKTDFAEPPE